jgi:hypothetical protein
MFFEARRAGEDAITAYGDYDDDGVRDDGEPALSFVNEWTPPPPPVQLSCACTDNPPRATEQGDHRVRP